MEKLINDFKISFTKGDTYALAVKLKNITEDLRLAYFTVKENADDEPLIQKSLGAGIDKIDDREYKKEKTYKVQLQSEDTLNLEARVQYLYDLRITVDNVVKTVLSGVFVLTHSVAGRHGTTLQDIEVAIAEEVEAEASTVPATNGIEYEQDPVATAKIGDLDKLATKNKKKLVDAINEVAYGALNAGVAVEKILRGESIPPKADHAEKDGNGDIIPDTYLKKDELPSIYQHIISLRCNVTETGSRDTVNAIITILGKGEAKFTLITLKEFLRMVGLDGYPINGFYCHGIDNVKAYPLLRAFVGDGNFGYDGTLYFSYTDCATGEDPANNIHQAIVGTQRINIDWCENVVLNDTVVKLL